LSGSEPSTARDPLERLAESFLERYRRGERPPLTEYTDAHPDLADDIRELFPALMEMEGLKPTLPPGIGAQPGGWVPDRLGEFRVLRVLGSGGMGIVYEAVQESLDRHVALKVLPPQYLANPMYLKRFYREARSAAGLHHSNIVPVFGVGEDQGHHFFAMQLIRGQTLEAALREVREMHGAAHARRSTEPGEGLCDLTRIALGLTTVTFHPARAQASGSDPTVVEPARERAAAAGQEPDANDALAGRDLARDYRAVARIARQVAEALAYAHEQGVLHRDIKPSNILIDDAGTAWVADFGLAKLTDGDDLSASHDVVGTLRYMAPERFDGWSDPRSDVYGLGVTLYELLTLRPAFGALDQPRLIQQVVHGSPPRPRHINRQVPRDLETICVKAMAREPIERYATAAALAEDLGRFLGDRTILARRSTPRERLWRWCRRNPSLAVAGCAAVGLGLVALAVSIAFGVSQARAARTLSTALAQANRVSADLALGRGLTACEAGDTDLGLLWLVRALEFSVRGRETSLERAIRRNLDGWSRRVPRLQGFLPHRDRVTTIAFSPRGDTLVTGGADGIVQTWDAKTWVPWGAAIDVRQTVRSAAFLRGGRSLVTVAGGVASIWDARDGRLVVRLEHPGAVTLALPDPAAERVLTAGESGVLRLWDAATGRAVGPALDHGGPVLSAAFRPDGRQILSGGADRRARLWDAATGRAVGNPLEHESEVVSVAFDSGGRLLLTGTEEGIARLWEAATGRRVGREITHRAAVTCVSFSPDGRLALTAGRDWDARLWHTATAAPAGPRMRHLDPVTVARFSADGRRVVTGSVDGRACLWDTATSERIGAPLNHWGEVHALVLSPDDRSLVAGGTPTAARVWELPPPPGGILTLDETVPLYSAAFDRQGRRVALGAEDGSVPVWDVAAGRRIARLATHRETVRGLAFRDDGGALLMGSEDGSASLWDLVAGKPIGPPLPAESRVFSVALSPSGASAAVGDREGSITLWDLGKTRRTTSFRGHYGPVWVLAYSPDGRTLLSAGTDHQARLWETNTGKPVGHPMPHPAAAHAAVFSPDGSLVATGDTGKTVRFWSAQTGAPAGRPFAGHDVVRALAFTPDGTTLVVGHADGVSRLCDVPSRKNCGPPLPLLDQVLAAGFPPDGHTVVIATEGRQVQRFPIPAPRPGSPRQIALEIQTQTGMRLDASDAVRELGREEWTRERRVLEDGSTRP
jgi:WD40 repeat protein/serine/threonine protein kinase